MGEGTSRALASLQERADFAAKIYRMLHETDGDPAEAPIHVVLQDLDIALRNYLRLLEPDGAQAASATSRPGRGKPRTLNNSRQALT
jgi:hypothetical protein